MGLYSGWQPVKSSLANILASLVGQDIVAKSFTSSQASGSDGFKATTAGARWHIGPGTTDYFSSNGATVITAAGILYAATMGVPADGFVILDNVGFVANIRFASSSGIEVLAPGGFLPSTSEAHSLGNATKQWSRLFLGMTDSSGTPGAATINKAAGISAIALGASSVVISNTMVTANSGIFISPRVRDATGLLPAVTARTVGTSFTVSVTANCTAALIFDWWIVN